MHTYALSLKRDRKQRGAIANIHQPQVQAMHGAELQHSRVETGHADVGASSPADLLKLAWTASTARAKSHGKNTGTISREVAEVLLRHSPRQKLHPGKFRRQPILEPEIKPVC